MTRLLGVAVVWMLLAPVLLTSLALGQGEVEAVISSVAERLRAVRSYLEAASPAEAARLRGAFEKALESLENARVKARVDPSTALAEVVRAQVSALNASREVLVKVNLTYPPGLLVALDVKLGMVLELNETIAYLRSANVTIEPWVEEKLKATAHSIEALKKGLLSGALNASHVAVKLGDVNKNISDVRVYLVKTAKPGWLKAQAISYVARELVKSIDIAGSAAKGNIRAVEELSQRLEALQRTVDMLPELGVPDDKLKNIIVCRVQLWGSEEFIAANVIARALKEVSGDPVKTRMLIAELIRCLKQPLERISPPPNVKDVVEKARKSADEIERESERQFMKDVEANPAASIGLVRAEHEILLKLYRDYVNGRVGADEVRVQALIVLKLAETAKQIAEKLPKPAQEQLLKTIESAISDARRMLEETKT